MPRHQPTERAARWAACVPPLEGVGAFGVLFRGRAVPDPRTRRAAHLQHRSRPHRATARRRSWTLISTAIGSPFLELLDRQGGSARSLVVADPAERSSKTMRLRYAGRCRSCSAALAKGDVAVYNTIAKKVLCLPRWMTGACPGSFTKVPLHPAPPPAISSGMCAGPRSAPCAGIRAHDVGRLGRGSRSPSGATRAIWPGCGPFRIGRFPCRAV